jgi:hypothetical protein
VNYAATNQFAIGQLPASSSHIAGPFVWSPPAPTQATQIGTLPSGAQYGHFCLLTRATCDEDPIHWTGGDWKSLARDNNLGVRNLLVIEPETAFPVTLDLSDTAVFLLDTLTLRHQNRIWLEIPVRILDEYELISNLSRQTLRVNRPEDNEDEEMIQLGIMGGSRLLVRSKAEEKVIVRSWFTKGDGGEGSGRAERVYLTQYIDGTEVGGCAIELAN